MAGKRGIEILTIGAATRDVFIQSKQLERVPDSDAPDGFDACVPLGAKIDVDHIIFETGGGATNAAVTFARFGFKTACACRIGEDGHGQVVVERMEAEGVNTDAVQLDPEEATGYSVILLAGTGQRAILVYRGASRRLDPTKIGWTPLAGRWIYLTSIGGDAATLSHIFTQVKKNDLHLAWNPGNAELHLGLKKLTPWIQRCDILNVNREEAALLAEAPPRDIERIMRRLGTLPRQALVVTDGARGAYVHSRGKTWHAPALPGKRINTTGAGDAFGSAFVAAAIKTGNLETAMRAGMVNALGVISHMGAKVGILKRFPTKTELARVQIKPV